MNENLKYIILGLCIIGLNIVSFWLGRHYDDDKPGTNPIDLMAYHWSNIAHLLINEIIPEVAMKQDVFLCEYCQQAGHPCGSCALEKCKECCHFIPDEDKLTAIALRRLERDHHLQKDELKKILEEYEDDE